jgi:hypothetical protein
MNLSVRENKESVKKMFVNYSLHRRDDQNSIFKAFLGVQ